MKTIVVSVSNDLYNDNRVLKTCQSLNNFGYNVVVLCKQAARSRQQQYSTFESENKFLCLKRLRFLFKKNVFYYAELNLRLFFRLLFTHSEVLWANDLDTLLPNYLVSRIKRIPLIFDSHEMFCYVAELRPNSLQQRVWLWIEGKIVPHLRYIVTVCQPIKDYFKDKYGVNSIIVRNIPAYTPKNQTPKHYPLPDKYIIWQGSTNIDRGLEELVMAMKRVDCRLLILGSGDIFPELQNLITANNLGDKVRLLGKVDFQTMMTMTQGATLGISIDKPTNRNYAISLPNKIFEYINAATPVLYSPLSEIKRIEEQYVCGIELKSYDTDDLAQQLNDIIADNTLLQTLSDNCLLAQNHLNWQTEETSLHTLLSSLE